MRLEYKYLLPLNKLKLVRKRISPFTNIDNKFQQSSEYTVRSIYFDTSQLKFYNEKIDGIRDRKKLRIRAYNQSNDKSVVFLEIKRKFENYISKNRAPFLFNEIESLLESKNPEEILLPLFEKEKSIGDTKKFLNWYFKLSLRPIILIVYEREAFYSRFDQQLRITFDKNLRYSFIQSIEQLFEEKNLIPVMPNSIIMEIKFNNGFPIWLQQIIQDMELSRIALSKYTICIDHKKEKFSYLTNAMFGLGSGINLFSNKN